MATQIYRNVRNAGAPTCTGVVGVSFFSTAKFRKSGAVRRYYRVAFKKADGGKSYRPFCIDTLGQAEAWKRALRFRAEYEGRVRLGMGGADCAGLNFQRSTSNAQRSTGRCAAR